MASIGAANMISVRGAVMGQGESVADITRPSVDGHALKQEGLRSPVSVVESVVDVADEAARNSALSIYSGMVGTTVTIIDDFGRTVTGCLIRNVWPVYSQLVVNPVGGATPGGTVVLACRWEVMVV